ncbi:MAG: RNA polymerase sigma factor SigZ [Desulfobacteraceae bacterium]|nr:RNA polymerase sigma factor SigZ [Desulfobacteraceae bacterium]
MTISEKIWQQYHAKLRAFVRSRVHDNTAAEDIIQDVFLKMHSRLGSLKDETKLKSWLYKITRNAVTDHFRLQKATTDDVPGQLPQPEAEGDPGEKVTRQLSECLWPMIQQLPEHYREAVILSELQGINQKEVARIQGISVSGVKSRVQRGCAILKDMLAECCRLEFDHGGRLCAYERKDKSGNFC